MTFIPHIIFESGFKCRAIDKNKLAYFLVPLCADRCIVKNICLYFLWSSRQISFLNCLGPAIDLEKVKSECLEPEPELRSTFSEEANTSSYYPAPAPVMDKYILDNGKVVF